MGQLEALQSRRVADESLNNLKDLIGARRALVKERTRIKNRSKNLTLRLLITQHRRRLDQIKQDMTAIDGAITTIIKNDPALSRRFDILVSIPGLAEKTAFAFLIDMPELGSMNAKQETSSRKRQAGNAKQETPSRARPWPGWLPSHASPDSGAARRGSPADERCCATPSTCPPSLQHGSMTT